MATDAAVTRWIEQLKTGDDEAARKLWEHYFERLVTLARTRLPSAGRRIADEEDVVLSAMDSFFCRVKNGNFAELHDRDNLWRLLARIICNKSCDLVRRLPTEGGESALGRGADSNQSLRGIDAWADEKCAVPFDASTMIKLADKEAIADFVGRLDLGSRELLAKLEDKKLRLVALRRLQGFTLTEIAKELGCVPSTIELKLRRIRKIWSKEIVP